MSFQKKIREKIAILKKMIAASVDKKTSMTSISVTFQDPKGCCSRSRFRSEEIAGIYNRLPYLQGKRGLSLFGEAF